MDDFRKCGIIPIAVTWDGEIRLLVMTDGSSTTTTERPCSLTRPDTRRLGPTTDDLLGQRAGSRSPTGLGHVPDDSEATGHVPVAELPDLSAEGYRLKMGASDPRDCREALVTALYTFALDTALGEAAI